MAPLIKPLGDFTMKIKTDLDLPPSQRTLANLWMARYFEAHKELGNANKGLRRLRRKLDRLSPNKLVQPRPQERCGLCGAQVHPTCCQNKTHPRKNAAG